MCVLYTVIIVAVAHAKVHIDLMNMKRELCNQIPVHIVLGQFDSIF